MRALAWYVQSQQPEDPEWRASSVFVCEAGFMCQVAAVGGHREARAFKLTIDCLNEAG